MNFTVSLKKNYEFRQVYNKGKSYANKLLVVIILPNCVDGNRLGISVSKKVGKSVARSRVTRLIRESYRLSENSVKKGLDIVVIARKGSADAAYREIEGALKHLLKKHTVFLLSGEKE